MTIVLTELEERLAKTARYDVGALKNLWLTCLVLEAEEPPRQGGGSQQEILTTRCPICRSGGGYHKEDTHREYLLHVLPPEGRYNIVISNHHDGKTEYPMPPDDDGKMTISTSSLSQMMDERSVLEGTVPLAWTGYSANFGIGPLGVLLKNQWLRGKGYGITILNRLSKYHRMNEAWLFRLEEPVALRREDLLQEIDEEGDSGSGSGSSPRMMPCVQLGLPMSEDELVGQQQVYKEMETYRGTSWVSKSWLCTEKKIPQDVVIHIFEFWRAAPPPYLFLGVGDLLFASEIINKMRDYHSFVVARPTAATSEPPTDDDNIEGDDTS